MISRTGPLVRIDGPLPSVISHPCIVSGGTFATESILRRCWHYNARDTISRRHIHEEDMRTEELREILQAELGWQEHVGPGC